MSSGSRPSYQSVETVYGSYTNLGNHASGGGIINVNNNNQTTYLFSLSNTEDNRLPFAGSDTHNHERQPKRRLTNYADPNPKRKRVGDFVKLTLDVAKDSTHLNDALKAALAGVSALIGHHEELQGVKDRIEGLQTQLGRIKPNITTRMINGDPDKTRPLIELISALGEIEKQSQEMLEKGRATPLEDKGKDSGEVARLVEQFREVISHYQISQRRATYVRITDLTSSFNTLLELQEKHPVVKNELDSVMGQLARLCLAEDSDNDKEHERWANLFDTLRLIKDKGNVLYNRINSQDYEECEDDIQAVSGITEDIRDALLDHQISHQRVIYDQNCRLIDAADLSVLNNCRRARGAAYQHGNRRGCLRGTRGTVLNEIETWTKDYTKSPVFWLNGLAGTGKSTIAQTIADRAFADGLLGASFFCSRDFEDRSDLHFIFPTLAFQLAHKFQGFRDHLVPLLQSNPDVVDESLYSQMEKLIVEPLRSADISTVIVVDAVDECKDDEPSSAILSVLGRLVEQIPKVKIFITGRPEPRIKTGFRLPLLEDATKVFVLHDVHPDLINSDILLFLKHELSEVAQRHGLDRWPSDEHINLLCQRAAGLFVYAVATVKFLDSKTHLPEQRLDVIVHVPQCTAHEGKTQFKPKTTLDSLYMSVLLTAFSEEDSEAYFKLQNIIGAVVLLVNPLPPSGIAELFNMNSREVVLLLKSIQSLLILDEDPTQPVKPFHKSFPDLVTDSSRCTDIRFYISPRCMHLQLAINCLRLLNKGLEQNLLCLPVYVLNSEVKDLQTRIDGRINVALRYACLSWHNHLPLSGGDITNVISRLRIFLEKKFLAWLEVVSVLKAMRGAVVALEKLMSWLSEVSKNAKLLAMARDCFYFVTNFFEPINASATHIYHSALELSPVSSIIRNLYYHQRLTPFPRVEIGIPDERDPSIAIPSRYSDASTWSPCGRFVAVRGSTDVEIRDALTFELVSTLQPAPRHLHYPDSPSYSPDGHSLACVTTTGIVIWDVQTGGVAKQIPCDFTMREPLVWSSETVREPLVWSSDGKVVGVLFRNTISIYDVSLGAEQQPSINLESGNQYLWAQNESFRVGTMVQDNQYFTLDIFEIIGAALTKIESFCARLQEGDSIVSFSPITYRISFSKPTRLVILELRNSKMLLDESGAFSSLHSFSSDGAYFAACGSSIRIWKYDGDLSGYIPWGSFPIVGSVDGPIQFSPTSSSILVSGDEALRIWRLDRTPIDHPYDNLQGLDNHHAIVPTKFRWRLSSSDDTWTDEWLKDHHRRCLLWLPMEWRTGWRNDRKLIHDLSTITFKSRDQKPIMIQLH